MENSKIEGSGVECPGKACHWLLENTGKAVKQVIARYRNGTTYS